MGIQNKELRRACQWLSHGKYSKVIQFLEPKVPLFLEDPDYYTILGRAYLESGMLKNAETYLVRGLQAAPAHLDIRLCLAVCHMKKKDSSSAVRVWLEILDDYPNNRFAAKGLRAVQRITDINSQTVFFEKLRTGPYLPNIRAKRPLGVFAMLTVPLLFLLFVYINRESWIFPVLRKSVAGQRPGAEYFLPGNQAAVGGESEDLYQIDEAEAVSLLKKSLRYFENYEDNSARFELNKIRNASISEETRKRVDNILKFLAPPTIESLETAYTVKEVSNNPRLYEGCWILWRGVTANVEFLEASISFDFLVGYEDGEVLEGRVPVIVPFLAVMEPLPLELLARVELVDDSFRLVAKTLYFIRDASKKQLQGTSKKQL